MTSNKKLHPIEICGTCDHRINERGSKGQYIIRCQLSHSIKSVDIKTCQYYEHKG